MVAILEVCARAGDLGVGAKEGGMTRIMMVFVTDDSPLQVQSTYSELL